MRRLFLRAGWLTLALLATPALAQEPPRFDFPAACTPGTDCWVVQYFDQDPSPAWGDYACGKRSYDKHDGTDIGVRDWAATDPGVAVIAAAPGKVAATRDGEDDRLFDPKNKEALSAKGCGNAVVIDHGGNWRSTYCHMKKGSVAVTTGQTVERGDRLGLIGQSGMAEFPHVHFGITHGRTKIDPFVGERPAASCAIGPGHLWSESALPKVAYQPSDIYILGIAGRFPKADEVRAGGVAADTLPRDTEQLVVYADVWGARAGDRVTLRAKGPDGKVMAEKNWQIDKDQIRIYRMIGMTRKGGLFPAGTWTGEAVLARDGGFERRAETKVEVR